MRIVFLGIIVFLFSTCKGQVIVTKEADVTNLERTLSYLTGTDAARNSNNVPVLDSIADYIRQELGQYCDTIYFQCYEVGGKTYKNVIGSINTQREQRLIIGAHYDVAGSQPGADDNASGVAGLLELARMLDGVELNYRIDFVAFTLEEPPFFGTKFMGSYIHAQSLAENKVPVKGMVCLEMIGFFNDKKGSQDYPARFLKLFYGSKGDFITVVQKFGNGNFGRKFKRKMKSNHLIRTKSFKAPSFTGGIDFSDHRNYWAFGYSAVMVTNTAFYRNKNYHRKTDTPQTLDLQRMANVVTGVYSALCRI
jgi:hypothetical protein